jgi:CDGSH-type Zn-finger protein
MKTLSQHKASRVIVRAINLNVLGLVLVLAGSAFFVPDVHADIAATVTWTDAINSWNQDDSNDVESYTGSSPGLWSSSSEVTHTILKKTVKPTSLTYTNDNTYVLCRAGNSCLGGYAYSDSVHTVTTYDGTYSPSPLPVSVSLGSFNLEDITSPYCGAFHSFVHQERTDYPPFDNDISDANFASPDTLYACRGTDHLVTNTTTTSPNGNTTTVNNDDTFSAELSDCGQSSVYASSIDTQYPTNQAHPGQIYWTEFPQSRIFSDPSAQTYTQFYQIAWATWTRSDAPGQVIQPLERLTAWLHIFGTW